MNLERINSEVEILFKHQMFNLIDYCAKYECVVDFINQCKKIFPHCYFGLRFDKLDNEWLISYDKDIDNTILSNLIEKYLINNSIYNFLIKKC